MFRFSVGGRSYQLPQTQYEITYDEGLQIIELEKAYGGNTLNYKVRVLEMLSGCDKLSEVVDEEIETIFKNLPIFSGATGIILNDVIKINDNKYGLVDLDTITAQEYIDIERVLDSVEDLNIASSTITAILYRPIKSIKKSLKTRFLNTMISISKSRFVKPVACVDYTLQPHDLDKARRRVEAIEKHLSYGHCLAPLYYYLNWKQITAKKYPIIFPEKDEKKKTEEPKIKKVSMSTIWGFEHQLGIISDDNRSEMDKYAAMNIKKVFRHLCYIIQKANFEKNNK